MRELRLHLRADRIVKLLQHRIVKMRCLRRRHPYPNIRVNLRCEDSRPPVVEAHHAAER